jgi:hypothetical protein
VKQTFSFCMIALVFASAGARADDEIVALPNRPTVSTTAQPVQPGILETEWGVDAASSHQDINGLVKFGLTSNSEVRLTNIPFTANSGMHGFGETAVGFKYRFTRDSGHQPSISLMYMYMFKAPTAATMLGSGEPDHSFTFLASKDVGKHHFDFNLIGNLLGMQTGGFHHNFLDALAWSHPIRGKWGATAEISGVTSTQDGVRRSAQFLTSALYTPKPRLVLDLGIIERIAGQIPHAMFVAGVTYSVASLYPRGRPHDEPAGHEAHTTKGRFLHNPMRLDAARPASQ